MGTNTLTTRVDGLAMVVDWFNDIKSLLCVDFVPRAITGIPTDEAGSIGSSTYRWKDAYFSGGVYVKDVDISQMTSDPKDPHRIISGKSVASGRPDFLECGALLTAYLRCVSTNLVCMINSVQITFSSDLQFTGLTAAPASNNTCLVNDTGLAGQASTKYLGEWDSLPITIDTTGSAISALNGTIAAFYNNNEIFLAMVDTTNNRLLPIYRGWANTIAETLTDNHTITLLKMNALLLKSDGIIKVSTTYYPESVSIAPAPGTSGKVYFERDTGKIAYDDGSSISRDYILLGYIICDSTHAVTVENFDFDLNWRDTSNVRLAIKDTTTITIKKNSFASVNGEYIAFIRDVDATQAGNLEAFESITANTTYYVYLSSAGVVYLSTKSPRCCSYPKRGWYHHEQYYRYIGQVSTDSASTFTKLSGGSVTSYEGSNATIPGHVNCEAQTFAGNKTFNDLIINKGSNISAQIQKSSGLICWSGMFYEKHFQVQAIAVGTDPWAGAFAPSCDRLYIPNNGSNNVTVLNPETNAIAATVGVGSGPYTACYVPSTDRVYVPNAATNTVSVINPVTNAVAATVTVETGPKNMAYCPTQDRIWIPCDNGSSSKIVVLNCVNNAAVTTVTMAHSVGESIYCPTNDKMYLCYSGNNQVLVYNVSTAVAEATISVGSNPLGGCYCPTNDMIYVVNSIAGTVSVIDCKTNTVVKTITVGSSPYDAKYNPMCDRVMVVNYGSDTVSVINPATNVIVSSVTVGNQPTGLCFHPRSNRMYVTNKGSADTVGVIQSF